MQHTDHHIQRIGMPCTNRQSRHPRCWLLWLSMTIGLLLLTGCSTPRTVAVESLTDPELSLPAREGATAAVLMARFDEAGRATQILHDRAELDLEERRVLADVQTGLRQAGFELVGTNDQPMLQIVCVEQSYVFEFDSYDRVPVFGFTQGTYSSRDRNRTYHSTTSTDVIVPVRVSEQRRAVTLLAYAGPEPVAIQAIDASGGRAVWRGRVLGQRGDVDDHLPGLVGDLMQSWGRTESRRVRID